MLLSLFIYCLFIHYLLKLNRILRPLFAGEVQITVIQKPVLKLSGNQIMTKRKDAITVF